MNWIVTHLKELAALLIGAGVTTLFEKAFGYNLADYLYDKIVGLFSKPAPSVKK